MIDSRISHLRSWWAALRKVSCLAFALVVSVGICPGKKGAVVLPVRSFALAKASAILLMLKWVVKGNFGGRKLGSDAV